MRMFTLSPRLTAAAGFLPKGAAIADIGCDHGRLPIYAVHYLEPSSVIACDIREAPLRRAEENCRRYEVEGRISLRLGDGLTPVSPDECTHITVCGMGGDMIASILSAASWTKRGEHTLILQPETRAYNLRKFLYEEGYEILDEKAVKDINRVYTVILAKGGAEPKIPCVLDRYCSPALRAKRGAAETELFTRTRSSIARKMNGFAPDSAEYAAYDEAKRTLEGIINEGMADRENA